MSVRIGIIGGSGLYDMAELTDREEKVLSTPFGEPSGPFVVATLRGKRVAFLARHGAGHRDLSDEEKRRQPEEDEEPAGIGACGDQHRGAHRRPRNTRHSAVGC